MRVYPIALLALLILVLASCGSTSLPTSSLTIRSATTNALISAPTATGTLTLTLGNSQQVRIMRTYRTDTGNTFTDDVTQFTNFKWSDSTGIATVDQLGNITGLAAGNTQLEAKFRENAFDPWDICLLNVEVN